MHFILVFFSEINLTSARVISLNDFVVILNRFELDTETYHSDSFLELCKMGPPISPKIKLHIEFQRLEINDGRHKVLNGVKTP